MGKIKIHEIAKKLGLTSKEIIERANELKIDVKTHLSGVTDEEAKRIEDSFQKKDDKNSNAKKENVTKKEEKTPVIIRREVIITENEPVKKQEERQVKENRNNSNNIGFVERKQNKDYNIVYRNKTNKPMTVNELFGIKPKKEEVKEESKNVVAEKVDVKIKEVEEVKKVEKVEEPKQVNTVVVNTQGNRSFDNREQRKPNENYQPNNNYQQNNNRNYENRNFDNRDRKPNNNFRNGQNQNNFNNRNNNNGNNNRFNNNKPGFGNNNGGNKFNNQKRPLDEKGIEKNIKNIIAETIPEKETVREYNKAIDKQKNNSKFDENRAVKKSKNKKGNQNGFDEGKLKTLKQSNRLSSMFDDESEGGMLDYYDLSTQRNRKAKKKQKDQEEVSKQKIFKLTEITIPEVITVKDLATELKKTASEVITKLIGYGIMATLNNELDFDTAFLVAEEFGVKAIKKEVVTEEDILFDDSEDKEEDLKPRPHKQ